MSDESVQDAVTSENLWRQGRILVCRRDARFPDRCVKSNDPVGRQRIKIKLKWHHPLLLLLGWRSSVRRAQTATVVLPIGLCPRCRRRASVIQGAVVIWLAASLIALLLGVAEITPFSLELVIGGGLGLVAGFVIDRCFCRVLVAKEIDSRYVRLRGASRDFLDQLPTWPGEKE